MFHGKEVAQEPSCVVREQVRERGRVTPPLLKSQGREEGRVRRLAVERHLVTRRTPRHRSSLRSSLCAPLYIAPFALLCVLVRDTLYLSELGLKHCELDAVRLRLLRLCARPVPTEDTHRDTEMCHAMRQVGGSRGRR